MVRETVEQRAERAKKALSIYQEPTTVRNVAERMGIAYGTAYALIKEAGGDDVFRPRGTRTKKA
jgi:transposase-like protein